MLRALLKLAINQSPSLAPGRCIDVLLTLFGIYVYNKVGRC